jgi:hypothetical protein
MTEQNTPAQSIANTNSRQPFTAPRVEDLGHVRTLTLLQDSGGIPGG